MTPHLTEDDVLDVVYGRPGARLDAEQHLDECADCLERVGRAAAEAASTSTRIQRAVALLPSLRGVLEQHFERKLGKRLDAASVDELEELVLATGAAANSRIEERRPVDRRWNALLCAAASLALAATIDLAARR